jgi:hypothetical protein
MIQDDDAKHSKNDYSRVDQWQSFYFVLSFESWREVQAIWRALCSDSRDRVERVESR